MPTSKYNAAFGGKPGSAAEARQAMVKTYGSATRANSVFYALVQARKKKLRRMRKLKRNH